MTGVDPAPRLVALDIDGTIRQPGGHVSPAVGEAVRRAADSGAHVVLATGRCDDEAAGIVDELGLSSAYAVCSNGARTVWFPDGEVVRVETFDPTPVIRLLLQYIPHARLAVDEPGFGYAVTESFPVGELIGRQRICDVDWLCGQETTRVVVRDVDSTAEKLLDLVDGLGLTGVSYSVGYNAWLDLMPEGINKAAALDQLAAQVGVDPAECLAIGDGRNDIEMLTWAGRGVAMGQAPPAVKASADAVTASVGAGGVAVELNRWFDGRSGDSG